MATKWRQAILDCCKSLSRRLLLVQKLQSIIGPTAISEHYATARDRLHLGSDSKPPCYSGVGDVGHVTRSRSLQRRRTHGRFPDVEKTSGEINNLYIPRRADLHARKPWRLDSLACHDRTDRLVLAAFIIRPDDFDNRCFWLPSGERGCACDQATLHRRLIRACSAPRAPVPSVARSPRAAC